MITSKYAPCDRPAWERFRRYRSDESVLKMAIAIKARYRAQYAEFERDCEIDRENGYTAHYCQHGASRWTDYDNICGPCEDGHTWEYGPSILRDAMAQAKAQHRKADEIFKGAVYFYSNGMMTREQQKMAIAEMMRYLDLEIMA